MDNHASVHFFLGTTCASGFFGHFQHAALQEGYTPYLIQSGPGCGKSTFMRKIAETHGGVEYLHCSSDPDSLDGVVLSPSQAILLDATAPHVIEPAEPGARERVVSLYDSLNNALLSERAQAIHYEFAQNSSYRKRAARFVAAAAALALDRRRIASCHTDEEKIEGFADRLAARLFPKQQRTAIEHRRFLSGITPKGLVLFRDTVPALADKIYVIQDDCGSVCDPLLNRLAQAALAAGYDIIRCACALQPESKTEHLFVPALRLAFVTSNSFHPLHFEGQNTIRGRRFRDEAELKQRRQRLTFSKRTMQELLEQAVSLMKEGKAHHDILEELYHTGVDFDRVNEIFARFTSTLE